MSGCESKSSSFRDQTISFERARWVIRCYYTVMLYFALALLPEWQGLLVRSTSAPLWPVMWLGSVDSRQGVFLILVLNLFGAMAAAIFPERRWARLLAFAGMFEFVAFNNSFGKIGHSLHLWILTAGLLVFLPDVRGKTQSRTTRQKFLTVFWACQAIILLTYTMAGIGKVAGAIYQLSQGQTNAFLPNALAEITANRLIETNSQSLLGPWLINHPLAGWPLMLADLYLQSFAICAAFRPSLQKLWAIALILFHIFSFLLLTINFAQNGLLLVLFFLNSPFVKSHDWRQMVNDLPLTGIFTRRWRPNPCES